MLVHSQSIKKAKITTINWLYSVEIRFIKSEKYSSGWSINLSSALHQQVASNDQRN
jgi:hypothetical protein